MYDWLDEIADEVVLAHPGKVRAIADARIKTDKIDSEILAHLLRADLDPAAYAPSREVRAIKRVLRQRLFLVRVQTMVKNRIWALLSQHAVELPKVTDLYGKAGMAWLHTVQLPDPDGRLLVEDLTLLEVLHDQIAATNGLLKELAAGDEAVRWLASLPGIGAFFSVLIRYEVDDIGRFRDARRFASYTGLVPSTYASGQRIVHGRLTKQGNKWLRWAFIEAVMPAICHSPSLRRFYEHHQSPTWDQRCPDGDRAKVGRVNLDGLDRATMLRAALMIDTRTHLRGEDPGCPRFRLGIRPPITRLGSRGSWEAEISDQYANRAWRRSPATGHSVPTKNAEVATMR